MSKNVFIHIGLPKTGTTFLQHKIHHNAEILRTNGIYIPKTGLNPRRQDYDYNLLALAMQADRWGQFPVDLREILPNLWADLLEEIEGCECDNILISAETLSWELSKKEQIQAVREKLHGFNVKVIICERDPYDFISSMYGHLLRTGRGPYSLESFILEFPYYWSPEFHKARWSEFFGVSNFVPLSYDRLSGTLLFEKFLSAVFPGHPICSERFELIGKVNSNTSLSPRFLRFLEELSANQVDIEPYIDLYLNSSINIVPLEPRVVTPADIDTALKNCGMALIVPTLDHQPYVSNVAGLPQRIKSDLFSRAPLMTSTVHELTEARTHLVERTERLELVSTDLVERTQELVETRDELIETRRLLVERTERLEVASTDLVERTQELVETRQVLIDRTALLEQIVNKGP